MIGREAARVQTDLCKRLILRRDNRPVATISAVDVSIQTDPSMGLGKSRLSKEKGAAACPFWEDLLKMQ